MQCVGLSVFWFSSLALWLSGFLVGFLFGCATQTPTTLPARATAKISVTLSGDYLTTMTGTCSTTLKVIGVTSVGLLGSSLSFQGMKAIPNMIRNINSGETAIDFQLAARTIRFGDAISAILTGLTSVALLLIYRAAPVSEKHPYLIYTALAAPVSMGLFWYKSWKNQKRVLRGACAERRKRTVATSAAEAGAAGAGATRTGATGAGKDDLAKSYIHVSDEESSVSTPSSSAPGSPQTAASAAKELEQELSIEEEVEQALRKKEHVHDLRSIAAAQVYGSGVAFVGFALGLVGLVGDVYFNV